MADVRTRIQTVAHVNGYLPPDVRVSRKLCEGGQGIVFEGHVFQERAAVKIYLPGQNATRIDREVNVMKQLRCDAVVRALWSGSVAVDGEDLPVVATQLLPGEPLDKALSQRRLTEDQIWTVVYDVADAIQNLWKLRIVHRDLKPSNVILLPTGRCCVIDLGLARHLDQSSLTAMGMTWGTVGYLSPEQARSVRQLTCKSDLFALGIIALEAFLGRHPTGRDQMRLLASSYQTTLPAPAASSKHASLLKQLLASRPSARPSPQQVLDALSAYARS